MRMYQHGKNWGWLILAGALLALIGRGLAWLLER